MKDHLLLKGHEKIEILLAKNHFSRGELRDDDTINCNGKRWLQTEQLVDDKTKRWVADFRYNWKCKHCDQSFAYPWMKDHMLSFHKTE